MPVIRRQSKRVMGRRYELHNPAAEMLVILVKVEDETRTRSDSKRDIIALLMTATKGIDVFV